MIITREMVLSTIDKAMADTDECSNTLNLAKAEFQSILEKGPIDGEWYITSHRPVIGKIIIIVKRFFRKMLHGYIPHIVEEENLRQEKQNRVLQYLLCLLERKTSNIDELNKSIRNQQKKIELLEQHIMALNYKCESSISNFEELCDLRFDEVNQKLENYTKIYEERARPYNDRLNDIAVKVAESQRELELQKSSVAEYVRELEQKTKRESEKINGILLDQKDYLVNEISLSNRTLQDRMASEENNRICEFDKINRYIESNSMRIDEKYSEMAHYSDFENTFRGDPSQIREWQSIYVDYFRGREKVVDIGCGRGEFLTLLQEASIPCKGIDQSEEMVELCRSQGLDAEQADMFDYLENVPDDTIDGVFCSQVVEHLTTNQLLRLISLLKIKVKVNSPVVIETINPGNINSSANGFYMDLTHVRPVHSSTLSFLMDKNGFPVDKVLYIHPETEKMLPHIEAEGAESMNRGIDNINRLLFDARDYAIIAYRG